MLDLTSVKCPYCGHHREAVEGREQYTCATCGMRCSWPWAAERATPRDSAKEAATLASVRETLAHAHDWIRDQKGYARGN